MDDVSSNIHEACVRALDVAGRAGVARWPRSQVSRRFFSSRIIPPFPVSMHRAWRPRGGVRRRRALFPESTRVHTQPSGGRARSSRSSRLASAARFSSLSLSLFLLPSSWRFSLSRTCYFSLFLPLLRLLVLLFLLLVLLHGSFGAPLFRGRIKDYIRAGVFRTSRERACGPVGSGARARARSQGKERRKIQSRRFRGSLFIDVRLRLSGGIIYGFRGRSELLIRPDAGGKCAPTHSGPTSPGTRKRNQILDLAAALGQLFEYYTGRRVIFKTFRAFGSCSR